MSTVETISEGELRTYLVRMVSEAGSQRALAKTLGISSVYLSDVMNGRRAISALAPRIGFEVEEARYRRVAA